MHINDAVFLEDLCPKFRLRQWRKSIHKFTGKSCIYCGKPSESIDHVLPRSQGGLSTTENCVPACLSCNGDSQSIILQEKVVYTAENHLNQLTMYYHVAKVA